MSRVQRRPTMFTPQMDLEARVRDLESAWLNNDIAYPPHGRLVLASAVNAGDATWQTVGADIGSWQLVSQSINGVDYNHLDWWTSGGAITIGRDGLIAADAYAEFAANSTGVRAIRFLHNSNVSTSQVQSIVSHNGGAAVRTHAHFKRRCEVGDTLEVQLFQNSGGSLSINVASFDWEWRSL